MSSALVARVTAVTHTGAVRPGNEDTIAVGPWIRNAPMVEPRQTVHELTEPLFCLVADGMGGHAAGEEASRLAAFGLAKGMPDVTDAAALENLVRRVNRELFAAMADAPERSGMGTTVVALLLRTDALLHINVGDSRLYRWRDGFLRQLSIDHVSERAALDTSGELTLRSHALTQCLGGAETFIEVAPHSGCEPVVAGWRYLLCSDGLTDMLSLHSIQARLAAATDDLDAVAGLLEAALAAGGLDNISILLVTLEVVDATSSPPVDSTALELGGSVEDQGHAL